VDPFVVIIFGGVAVIVVFVLLLGKFYPGSGADVLDWKHNSAAIETQIENELDDVQQMVDAANERRRRAGKPERTEREVREEVAIEQRELNALAEARLEQEEIRQLLAVKNERRRSRGEPEISEEQFRAGVEGQGTAAPLVDPGPEPDPPPSG
jgi:hypothetical protein